MHPLRKLRETAKPTYVIRNSCTDIPATTLHKSNC
jgi:hypothetical protein